MMTALAEAGLLPLADRPYEDTLALKAGWVKEAFSRRGLQADVRPTVPSPRIAGARARVKVRADDAGRLGFFRPGTHEFVHVPLAGLVRPEVAAEAARLEALGTARGEFELRSDGERVVVVAEAPVMGARDIAIRGRSVRGDATLRIDGLRVSPGSFYQVNLELNRALAATVDARIAGAAPAGLLDLYGGIGNFSVGAARRGTAVVLVESSPDAASDARHNLGAGATVIKGDAGRVRAGEHLADVVILDPPRAGAPGVLATLALVRPRVIVYVSCDPVSLARDVASIEGYDLAHVEPWDMFPFAEHVETLVVLERGAAPGVDARGRLKHRRL